MLCKDRYYMESIQYLKKGITGSVFQAFMLFTSHINKSLTAIIGNERCIMRVWVLAHCNFARANN